MADTFRALCAELTKRLDELNCLYNVPSQSDLIERSHTTLAETDEPDVPAPPADGEVAELVAWLQEEADDYECIGSEDSAARCNRAAELLQRQVLVPVPVSERPGLEDCDAEGRCWWLALNQSWPCLYLMKADIALAAAVATHWLPAHALPLPEVNND